MDDYLNMFTMATSVVNGLGLFSHYGRGTHKKKICLHLFAISKWIGFVLAILVEDLTRNIPVKLYQISLEGDAF